MTLRQARPWVGELVGVGLDSAEVGNPPEKFAGVYAEAGRMGLHAVAHAGEEGGPELVARTLDVLHVRPHRSRRAVAGGSRARRARLVR